MECKGQEQKFSEHEKKQCEGQKCRKRAAQDDSEDEVQEFFALVDRIHVMHNLYKQNPMNCSSAEENPRSQIVGSNDMEGKSMNCPSAGETPTSQIVGDHVIQGKSPWKPSFQFEDFSALGGKDCSFTDCSNNASTSVVCEKSCNRSDQNVGVRSFDLNVEATAEE